MSGPTKAGEPSMDEILASIRKIIAEDPSKAPAEAKKIPPSFGAGAAPGPAPVASQPARESTRAIPSSGRSFGGPPAADRASPSFGRLSEALRTTFASNPPQSTGSFADTRFGQSAPSSPLSSSDRGAEIDPLGPGFEQSERSRSIDNDLDDLLAEPIAEAVPVAPVREAGDRSDASNQWAVWRSPSTRNNDKPDSAPGTSPAAPPPTPSLGRPSGGFYPTTSSYAAPPPGASPPSTFIGSAKAEPTLPHADAEQNSFGTVVPSRSAETSPLPGLPRFEPRLPVATSESPGPADPAPAEKVVIASMPSTSSSQPNDAGSVAPSAGASTVSVPLPPRTTLFSRPVTSAKVETLAPSPAPASVEQATPPAPVPSYAASIPTAEPASSRAPSVQLPATAGSGPVSALNALAAGLAASNAHSTPAVPSATASAVVPVAAPPEPAVQSVSNHAVRTLEDTVADMVKPMLQRWIDDNMPRIIEKALRNEVGQPGGGGTKPPGT